MAFAGHSSCGACKFLRRKCERGCLYAPYFSPEEGAAEFAAIHKVFGASKIGKFLRRVPVEDRGNVARTVAYEAHARLSDPVSGCVRQIFALQQQVASLEAQLMQAKAELAHISAINLRQPEPEPEPRAASPQQEEESIADPCDHTSENVGHASPEKNDNEKEEARPSELHCQHLPQGSSLDQINDQNVLECNDLDKWIEHFFLHYKDDLFLDF